MSLTFILTCALISLVVIYYFLLKQKYLLRAVIKYKENHLITSIDYYSNGESIGRDKNNNEDGGLRLKSIHQIPGPKSLPLIGTKWIYMLKYKLSKVHEAYEDLRRQYGNIVLEVGNGNPFVHLFAKDDIEKVLRFSSKYPFRPPTSIVAAYRQLRPDRYSSLGVVNE